MMKKRISSWAVTICGGLALAGLETPADAQDYDLLPFIEVGPGEPQTGDYLSPVGGYVRFWIERDAPDASEERAAIARNYDDEARSAFARFFVGRNYSRLLHARLIVNRPTMITQTVTLASASHESNRRQGESWNSELGERRFLTPYFRVDPGTTAAFEVSLSVTRRIDADITRNILSIVDRAARLVAPSAPLVTSLNSDRLTETSDFVDSSISRLFGEAVVERSQTDFPAERWYREPDGEAEPWLVTVLAAFPMTGHVWNDTGRQGLRQWRVRASEPIVSIFSSVPLHRRDGTASAPSPCAGTDGKARLAGEDLQACMAFAGLLPSRVLGLQVAENVTLGQSLRGDAGITAAIQHFQDADDDGDREDAAREICNLVSERAETLGLNAYDAAAALWAFATTGALEQAVADKIWDGICPSAQLAIRLGLQAVPASADLVQVSDPSVEGTTPDAVEPVTGGGLDSD